MSKLIKRFKWNNIIWVLFITALVYVVIASIISQVMMVLVYLAFGLKNLPSAVQFVNEYYTSTIGAVIVLVLYCLIFKKNRFILRSFLPKGMMKDHKILVVEDTYEPTQNNTPKTLLIGLALGFLLNFACIVCALIHGDIKLYFDFSAAEIPFMLFAFFMVFIQSSSEEMWCRGFMSERIQIHYPLWVAVLANGAFFGALHLFNEGATPLAIADIVMCGISFSLLRWYTGSMWMVMGLHAMWNFNQNFLFGLPNSGLVSEFSVFHLDAATGNPSLIYDYIFGVEGALPAIILDSTLGVVILLLAKKNGRLGELLMSYEKKAALKAGTEENTEPDIVPTESTETSVAPTESNESDADAGKETAPEESTEDTEAQV